MFIENGGAFIRTHLEIRSSKCFKSLSVYLIQTDILHNYNHTCLQKLIIIVT